MKYLYCKDEALSSTLSKQAKLLNTISTSNGKVSVFEYEPTLFSLDFNDIEIKKKCVISDKLNMYF